MELRLGTWIGSVGIFGLSEFCQKCWEDACFGFYIWCFVICCDVFLWKVSFDCSSAESIKFLCVSAFHMLKLTTYGDMDAHKRVILYSWKSWMFETYRNTMFPFAFQLDPRKKSCRHAKLNLEMIHWSDYFPNAWKRRQNDSIQHLSCEIFEMGTWIKQTTFEDFGRFHCTWYGCKWKYFEDWYIYECNNGRWTFERCVCVCVFPPLRYEIVQLAIYQVSRQVDTSEHNLWAVLACPEHSHWQEKHEDQLA